MPARRIPLEKPPSAAVEARVKRQQTALNRLIGANIKKARTEAALSLRQLQTRCDISANYLSGLERGLHSPTINTLVKIAVHLNTTVADLISE